jgi:transketolase
VTGSSTQDLPLSTGTWTALDRRAVDTARILAADAVEAAGNGHPGTAMSLAPVAHLLFQRYLRHDPADPDWIGRDRFVLSCGHTSLTLYIQLFLTGYGVELDDLRTFRTWGSLTPGHPEVGHTPGVETTTGPLGQGVANAVGLAMAARREAQLLAPGAPVGSTPFDHRVFALASDGDLQEGVAAEASSLAGHLELGNLVLVYDDNRISIDGRTDLAFTEDVGARYAAYGWHVQHVELASDGDVDVAGLARALDAACAESQRPSIIVLRTTIAWPAPNAQDTSASHGARLGPDEVAATKTLLGFDPAATFAVADDVLRHTRRAAREHADRVRAEWQQGFDAWAEANPQGLVLFERLAAGVLPEGWQESLPTFDGVAAVATRKASAKILGALAPVLPELWGGSADLGESNGTDIAGDSPFRPAETASGRRIHFGVREHAMGAIMNGIALHGRSRVFGGTFLVFSDYMRPAVRMAALMGLPVTYVWTHDSIGLGEDGPTHQPVEHLAALRAIPGLDVVRPADAHETAHAWIAALTSIDRPTALILTRQDVDVLTPPTSATVDGVRRGGYVLADTEGEPAAIIIATGSEVALAVEARDRLAAAGVPVRVVSMPCVERFRAQTQEYRDDVLPPGITARVSVEASVTWPWAEFVGPAGASVGIDRFGASASAATLFREFGITADAVVDAVLTVVGSR